MYTPRRDDEHHRYFCMGKRSIAKRMKRKIPYLKFSSDLISHGVFVVVVLFWLFLNSIPSFFDTSDNFSGRIQPSVVIKRTLKV